MKRKIKFRGQSKDTNEWEYGHLVIKDEIIYNGLGPHYDIDGELKFEAKYYIYNEDDDRELIDNFIEVFPETVGQFIEKLDKTGKEIYEGDIVKNTFFVSECTTIERVDDIRYLDRISKTESEREVIGNIHIPTTTTKR